MQVTVSLTFELPATGSVDSLQPIILDAGRQAMIGALKAACRKYEAMVPACPRCGATTLTGEGHDRRVVLRSFGRVELQLQRLRSRKCGRRFRAAEPFLDCLAGANVSAKLRQAAILAGTSWPHAVAAGVLGDLCGAVISPETVRRLTNSAGRERR